MAARWRRRLRAGLAASLALVALGAIGPGDAGTSTRYPQQVVFHGARGAKQPAPPSKLPSTVASRVGQTAIEPTLGITRNGTVFFQAAHPYAPAPATHNLAHQTPDVLKSPRGNLSWVKTSPTVAGRNKHALTFDPYLHVDPVTDRVFTVDWLLPTKCSQLSFSDDEGETWTSTVLDCAGIDHQNVFTGPPAISRTVGYPNVVYYCASWIPSVECSKSLDGGLSFVPTGAPPFASIAGAGIWCGRLSGHGTVGPDGTVYLPATCDRPYLAISRDEGATWEVVAVSQGGTNGDHEAAVGVDDDGTVYYSWVGEDRLPYLAYSTDGGEQWSPPVGIAPPGVVEANLPGLAVSPDGRVAVTYMASRDAPADQRSYLDATWAAYVTVTEDATVRNPLFASAWFGSRTDPLVRGKCGPGRCQVELDFIDVQFDSRGAAWIAFVDGCNRTTCVQLHDNTSYNFGDGVVGALFPWST